MSSITRIDTGNRHRGKSVIRYKVRWREGGRGSKERSKMCDTESEAKLFLARLQVGEPAAPSPRPTEQTE